MAIRIAIWLMLCLFINAQDASWGYDQTSTDNPFTWSSNYKRCASSSQSPIDIKTSQVTPAFANMLFQQLTPNGAVKLSNNGYTLELDVSARGITLSSEALIGTYKLYTILFHIASEHVVNGVRAPAELQMYFMNADGYLATIAVLINVGEENTFLRPIISLASQVPEPNMSINVTDFVWNYEANGAFFEYQGSLTIPECSEVVQWFIQEAPITISPDQMSMLSNIIRNTNGGWDNYRPLNPLNSRTITKRIISPATPSVVQRAWSYLYQGSWSSLYPRCGSSSQSPIDISSSYAIPVDNAVITISGMPAKGKITLYVSDFGIRADMSNLGVGLSSNRVNGNFSLSYALFRIDGEHKVNGVAKSGEIQLVFLDQYKFATVVAIRLEIGSGDHQWLQKFTEVMDTLNLNTTISQPFDFTYDYYPETPIYEYQGSDTMPPCGEVVTWFIQNTTWQISQKQYDSMARIVRTLNKQNSNSRVTQPTYNRAVYVLNSIKYVQTAGENMSTKQIAVVVGVICGSLLLIGILVAFLIQYCTRSAFQTKLQNIYDEDEEGRVGR